MVPPAAVRPCYRYGRGVNRLCLAGPDQAAEGHVCLLANAHFLGIPVIQLASDSATGKSMLNQSPPLESDLLWGCLCARQLLLRTALCSAIWQKAAAHRAATWRQDELQLRHLALFCRRAVTQACNNADFSRSHWV